MVSIVFLAGFAILFSQDVSSETTLWSDKDFSKTIIPFEYIDEPLVRVDDATKASTRLEEFTKREFSQKEVIKVGDRIFVAIGFALGNSIMIEGDDGVIIVDTTENPESMKEIMVEFRKYSEKPVMAIIFTHFHTDHITGTNAILEEEIKNRPNASIPIYAHALTKQLMSGFSDTYEIGLVRGVRMLGSLLTPTGPGATGSGLGPFLLINTNASLYIPAPTVTYNDRAKFNVAGIEFELIHTPGETMDQTTVWIEELNAVLPGDNIYKTFPNLYTIRGSPARDAKQWYQSLDRIRELGAEYLVGSHTTPVIGKTAVYNSLLVYRDAIKYLHDQTLRLLNKGFTADQIIQMVKLPDSLSDHPFLQEHYGTIPWSIRGIFTNYLGWFDGNPRKLNPMTDAERGSRMLRLVENARLSRKPATEILLQEAQKSHEKSVNQYRRMGMHSTVDDKWALELVNDLLAINSLNNDLKKVAKTIQVSALRAIGIEQVSPNGRNYYLTYALEIETGMSLQRTKEGRAFVINTSTIDEVLKMLCAKVNGLKCQCKNITVGLDFTDLDKTFALTLRNSVCDVHTQIPSDTDLDVYLSTTSAVYKAIKAEDQDLDTEIALGNVELLAGTMEIYKSFLECFDPVNSA